MNRQQDSEGVILTGYHLNTETKSTSINCQDEGDHIPILSRRSGHYNVHSHATNAVEKRPYSRCSSQDSLDDLSMDDYWTEVENMDKTRSNDQEQQEEVLVKVPDDGELEEEWLKEAGLSNLIGDPLADPQESIVLLSTLTRTQAAAVERRVETLKQTLRKKNKQYQVPDVRDVFGLSGAQNTKLSDNDDVPAERSENGKQDVVSDDVTNVSGNVRNHPKQDVAVSETDINLEISFSEQAVSFKEKLKNTKAQDDEDDAHLPDFKLPKDKTGTTKIGDLASQDMKKVRSLALIELTALFDAFGIEFKALKSVKSKLKESGLFGVPLTTLLEQDQKKVQGTRVPLILHKIISHIEEEGLETEGLLRIPGVATRVKTICEELEAKFYEGTFVWDSVKQHDAASLLKLFIRELPHPLLTLEYLNAFIAVQKPNRGTLKALVEFLQRVINNREKNKMTLKNVAVVMAPNLFMCKGVRSKASDQQEFAVATGTANIVWLLIRYQNVLWTIPKFIVNQVRKQNMENQKKMTKERAMKKLLKKMAYDREKADKHEKNLTESDSLQGVIRVQAPQFTKVSMAIQLTEELKASDVLARFLSQESAVSIKREELSLFEIGGNIGERCLDDETYMKDLLQLNPSAEWVIKSRSR
ncbi:rho GTPase-activating protein 18 isoform X3 [Lepisosteus oculatus]|uniref:rho GTPase-activating protein 18 isoform X3 n=1 Tax=Lepisosteus oculatus TaxID=7918 RepID=UPI00073FFA6A|nr:PREDICTED: rho GTPase-activating protein 18 isoform X2 [Lepisosteus oculatus]